MIDPNDICIFDYQGTTTFGYAIKNQNPIILIDFNTHTLKEMDHEVRAKRVLRYKAISMTKTYQP